MKTSTLFLLIGILSVSASTYSQEAKVTIQIRNSTISDVFSKIREQTNYSFWYDHKDVNVNEKVDLDVRNETVKNVLSNLLKDQSVDFALKGNHIVIYKKTEKGKDYGDSLSPQQTRRKITGVVVDEKNESIPGANIIIQGTTTGAVSDMNGNFSIEVENNAVLIVSYIGYDRQEIAVRNQQHIQVILEESSYLLDQAVVISYGKVAKKEIIGSVATVNMDGVNSTPYNRVEQILQGKVPGVVATQSTGEPGAPMNISVRGYGTIGNSDPLYVIDGIPTKSALNSINPNDIESISVLKDASAASMYGSRAANGVILITTKSGKVDRFTIDFDAYAGVQSNLKKIDMLNASQWAEIRNKATLNDNPNGTVPWANTNLGEGTDWQNAILRDALIQNYNLSVTGGSEKTRYALSLNHFDQNGIIRYSDYMRNSIRANIDASPAKWVNIGNNFSFSQIKHSGVPIEINGVLKNAILAVPTMKVYNENGSFAGPNMITEGNGRNPLSMAANANVNNTSYRITDNLYSELLLTRGLTFKSSLGLDLLIQNDRDFNPTFKEGDAENNVNSLNLITNLQLDWIWENVVNYNLSVNDHNVKALAGFSMEENIRDWNDITKSVFPGNGDYLQYLSNGSVVDAKDVNGLREEWAMVSYFGRLDYNYMHKYLLSANVRVDASSRFAKGNRSAVFPSFALGWRMSEEKFLKEYEWLDDLKLKASWGQLGNQDIGLYAFRGMLNPYYYNFDGQAVVGYAPGAPFNEKISWETTTQADAGFEFMAFRGALALEAGYYNKRTTDMLVQLPVSSVNGFTRSAYQNAGSIRNTGFEVSLTHAKNSGNFTYNINANISTIKNRVLSLGGNEQPIDDALFFDYTVRSEKGLPMRQMYGYVMEGIYQDEDEIKAHLYNTTNPAFKLGDIKYKDLNSNGRFDAGDRTVIGNTLPEFVYGFSINAAYKGIDLSMQIQGVGGNDIYNAAKWWSENTGETHNYGKSILNSWDGKGSSNTMPRLTLGATQNNIASTRYVEKGDYLRLKNLQIGYTLPKSLVNKLLIRSLRVYTNAQNLFTITGYKGFNPEVGMSRGGNRNSFGFDEITYPQAQVFTFGVNIGIF